MDPAAAVMISGLATAIMGDLLTGVETALGPRSGLWGKVDRSRKVREQRGLTGVVLVSYGRRSSPKRRMSWIKLKAGPQ